MPLHMAFLANNCPTLLTSLKLYQIESQPNTISTISLLDQLWYIIDQNLNTVADKLHHVFTKFSIGNVIFSHQPNDLQNYTTANAVHCFS